MSEPPPLPIPPGIPKQPPLPTPAPIQFQAPASTPGPVAVSPVVAIKDALSRERLLAMVWIAVRAEIPANDLEPLVVACTDPEKTHLAVERMNAVPWGERALVPYLNETFNDAPLDANSNPLHEELEQLMAVGAEEDVPSYEDLADWEIRMLEDILNKITDGQPKHTVLRAIRSKYHLPFFFCSRAMTHALHMAENMNQVTLGEIIAGSQLDISRAIKDNDVRATIAARKAHAQYTGHDRVSDGTNINNMGEALAMVMMKMMQGGQKNDDDAILGAVE